MACLWIVFFNFTWILKTNTFFKRKGNNRKIKKVKLLSLLTLNGNHIGARRWRYPKILTQHNLLLGKMIKHQTYHLLHSYHHYHYHYCFHSTHHLHLPYHYYYFYRCYWYEVDRGDSCDECKFDEDQCVDEFLIV